MRMRLRAPRSGEFASIGPDVGPALSLAARWSELPGFDHAFDHAEQVGVADWLHEIVVDPQLAGARDVVRLLRRAEHDDREVFELRVVSDPVQDLDARLTGQL